MRKERACEAKQINSANEDVSPQWCYLWSRQGQLFLFKILRHSCFVYPCRDVLRNKAERLTNTFLPAFREVNGLTKCVLVRTDGRAMAKSIGNNLLLL